MEVTLQILHGRLKSGTGVPKVEGFTIRQPQFVIGSDADSNMVCRSRLVSPKHCQITLSDHGAVLDDLDSEHGTFVNGIRVEIPTALKTGDLLKIGRLEFFVTLGRSPIVPPAIDDSQNSSRPVARDTVAMSASAAETVVDPPPIETPAAAKESVDDLVTQLLEEADEQERELRRTDPASRYMKVETPVPSAKKEPKAEPDADLAEERRKRPPRKRPIKIPAEKLEQTPHITGKDSVNAAELALEELLRAPKKH